MLEIVIVTVVIILLFIGVSWFAYQRSQKRAEAFEKELDMRTADEENFESKFDSLFEDALNEESGSDDSVSVTLSAESENIDLEDAEHVEKIQINESEEDLDSVVKQPTPQRDNWSMVLAFTIMASDGNAFTGRAVKAALEENDMHFGDMQIYHRYTSDVDRQTLFSVANILDPGTLLPDGFVSMTTPGLLIFSQLPGPISGLAIYDELLITADAICASLGGTLCNEARQAITDENLEETRAKIFKYQMAIQQETEQLSNDFIN